jgi:hypothetical protein
MFMLPDLSIRGGTRYFYPSKMNDFLYLLNLKSVV